jgi:hypothetical protein
MTYMTMDNGITRACTQAEVNDIIARGVPNIPALKATKNTEINLARAAANQTTFPYLGKLIACDPLSRSDIDAVANSIGLTGTFPDGFPMAWKAVDNSYISIPDVSAFKALYAAMVAEGTSNFNKSQQLKATLASAVTEVDIGAIVWGE